MSGAHTDKPAERTLRQWIVLAVSTSLLLLAAGIAALVIVLPAVTGGAALTVLTSSMSPRYPAGSLIVIRPVPIDDIHIGDVLTYQIASGRADVVSHRVVERQVNTEDGSLSFITKGDNNDVADPSPVQEVQVKGTLWYSLPVLGWVNSAVNGSARAFVVPLVAGLLFAYGAWSIIATVRDRQRHEHPRRSTWQRRRWVVRG